MNNLFQLGDFTLNSGKKSLWKIECDALTKEDWEGLARMAYEKLNTKFGKVEGVPRGGIPFAKAMEKYITPGNETILICEDVVTTGKSMEKFIDNKITNEYIGVAVFARNKVADWIIPIFQM